MSTTCPTCGVAVTPGYVRCPKCHGVLPVRTGRALDAGGTALPERANSGPTILLAAAAAAVLAVLVYAAMREPTAPAAAPVAVPALAAPARPVATTPDVPAEPPTTSPLLTRASDPTAAIADLDRQLDRQRLWSTTKRIGTRLDLRGTSCADPAMGPTLDGAAPALKAGGITKLRCLAQAGTVIIDRDL